MLYTPKNTVAYEGLIALAAHSAMAGSPPMSGPVALEIMTIHSIPASWSKKKKLAASNGEVHPCVTPDADNILKAIGDGGNGVLWVDDRQIVRIKLSRSYGGTPSLWVSVAAIKGV
jgi:Holliday junction resolvase RusA-like endonuclease